MIPHVYVMGDLHGQAQPIKNVVALNPEFKQDAAAGKKNILILLGDAGLNYYLDVRDKKFKIELAKYPFEYFVIRGNHEQRPTILAERAQKSHSVNKWHVEYYWDGPVLVEDKYPYIKYATDCISIYNIPYDIDTTTETPTYKTYKTVVIPGAYSADKWYRLQKGWNWFQEEQLSWDEMNQGELFLRSIGWKVDLVLSHTCPRKYEPTDLFLPTVDQNSVDKSMEDFLDKLDNNLDYKAWLWGHYHDFRDYPRFDGRYRTMLYNVKALDLFEYMKGNIRRV